MKATEMCKYAVMPNLHKGEYKIEKRQFGSSMTSSMVNSEIKKLSRRKASRNLTRFNRNLPQA